MVMFLHDFMNATSWYLTLPWHVRHSVKNGEFDELLALWVTTEMVTILRNSKLNLNI